MDPFLLTVFAALDTAEEQLSEPWPKVKQVEHFDLTNLLLHDGHKT